jgi:oligopeptide/dipeptide ABC transporter ATP-binding protein
MSAASSASDMAAADDAQLVVTALRTEFATEAGPIRAVRDVSFTVRRQKTLALVGESGSGKSVTSLSIMRLLAEPQGRITSGSILLRCKDGTSRDLARLDEVALGRIRGNEVAMIFQEPMTSLNPVQQVGAQITEAILLHERVSRRVAIERARELLARVDVPDPDQRMMNYPHQMSGGMRQRIMIAMALACNPALLIADEPTTALDVTVQAQVLALMRGLQRDFGMAILFITHNLGVVAAMASEVAVMYGGMIVERGDVASIFRRPRHPYTIGLLNSLPKPNVDAALDRRQRRLQAIPGNVPAPGNMPKGCAFAPRCAHRIERCEEAVPDFAQAEAEHLTRCIRWDEVT